MGGSVFPSRGVPFDLSQDPSKRSGKEPQSQDAKVAHKASQPRWISRRAMAAQCNAKAAQEAIAANLATKANKAMAATQAEEARAKGAEQDPCHQPERPDCPLSSLAPFDRLRKCMGWWEKYAPQFVLNLISFGVEKRFPKIELPLVDQQKSREEKDLAMRVMSEYVEAKAAKEIPMAGTKYLVLWFVIRKMEANGKEKLRLISDCREIDKMLNPPGSNWTIGKIFFRNWKKGCGPQKWT